MIRRTGSEPSIGQIETPTVEISEVENPVTASTDGLELERPSRSDRASQKSETDLSGLSRRSGLNSQLLESRADAIFKACEGLGTDERSLLKNLSGMSAEDRKDLNEIYQKKFGKSLDTQVREELSGEDLESAQNLLNGKEHTIGHRALEIHRACEGLGTDKNAVLKNLSGMTAQQRDQLQQAYQAKYGKSLDDELAGELSGSDLQQAMKLLHGKPGKSDSQDLEHPGKLTSHRPSALDNARKPATVQAMGLGSSGPAVQDLQKQINESRAMNGKPPIAVDGKFGPETQAAIKEFQQLNGLVSDGIAGPKTLALLERQVMSNKIG